MKNLLVDLGVIVDVPVAYYDNICTELLAKNPILRAWTEHVEIELLFNKRISNYKASRSQICRI